MQEIKAKRAVQSVEVGGRLLLALARQSGPMTLKDLAGAADLPPSRAHPYLVSFGRLGMIEQEKISGAYRLGPAALQIGLASLRQLNPVEQATPVASALAEQTGQTVFVALWANFGPTVVRMFESRQPLHVNMRLGTVMSVLGTATGRAFAATLPKAVLVNAMSGALGDTVRANRSALNNLDHELDTELAHIAREFVAHGVTRAVGRPIPSVNAFSAPAYDHDDKVALVVTIMGHEDSFSGNWNSTMAVAVLEAANTISARLGSSKSHADFHAT